jgi:hypothetical protein
MAIEPSPPVACPTTAVPVAATIPTRAPIAHQTRSFANAPLALFAGCHPYHKCIQYHIPTAKATRALVEQLMFAGLRKVLAMTPKEVNGFANLCKSNYNLDIPSVLSILDPAAGKFLQHCQLRQDPCYKS